MSNSMNRVCDLRVFVIVSVVLSKFCWLLFYHLSTWWTKNIISIIIFKMMIDFENQVNRT